MTPTSAFGTTTDFGWTSSTATADSVYGKQSSAVTPAAIGSIAGATLTIQLVKLQLKIAPSTWAGTAFHAAARITKPGDSNCAARTISVLIDGNNTRNTPVTCGAGVYRVEFLSSVVNGVTLTPTTASSVIFLTVTGAAPVNATAGTSATFAP